jgi:hypothetical protein
MKRKVFTVDELTSLYVGLSKSEVISQYKAWAGYSYDELFCHGCKKVEQYRNDLINLNLILSDNRQYKVKEKVKLSKAQIENKNTVFVSQLYRWIE